MTEDEIKSYVDHIVYSKYKLTQEYVHNRFNDPDLKGKDRKYLDALIEEIRIKDIKLVLSNLFLVMMSEGKSDEIKEFSQDLFKECLDLATGHHEERENHSNNLESALKGLAEALGINTEEDEESTDEL